MSSHADAADQVIHMSLEGVELAVRVSGAGAKNLAMILAALLKEETKTKGKTRLSQLLRSGKELTVFTLPTKDLQVFIAEAKRYGVLYSAIKEKGKEDGMTDIITRVEDAPKVNRIIERFQLVTVKKGGDEKTASSESREEALIRDILNPRPGRMETGRPFGPDLKKENRIRNPDSIYDAERPSVRERLAAYRKRHHEQEAGMSKALFGKKKEEMEDR